jgi:hypothetical protein
MLLKALLQILFSIRSERLLVEAIDDNLCTGGGWPHQATRGLQGEPESAHLISVEPQYA